jgi:tripartite-type tricarboxylate transporter receptor subunit TctC
MMRRRAVLAAALAPSLAHAQLAFTGPITIVVPFAPGGSSDLMARLIGERIAATLGRPVIVENQAGGGGRIAARSVQAAPPNGARLLLANTSVMVLTPLAFADAGYDPLVGFAPVAGAADFAAGLASGRLTGAADLAALSAWLRANPAQANAGVPALGSLPHLTALAYGRAIGVALTMVPYRGGAPIAQELIGGRIPVGLGAAADFAALHQAGELRLLAVTGPSRAPGLPEVPTFAEAGLVGFEANAWNGFFAPAGTPEPVIAALHGAISAALAEPALRARLEQVALIAAPATPAELRGFILRDRASFGPLIAAAGPLSQ